MSPRIIPTSFQHKESMTPGSVLLGTCICYTYIETNLIPKSVVISRWTLHFEHLMTRAGLLPRSSIVEKSTISHQKLKKNSLSSIIRNAFIFKNGNRRYKYLVLGHEETYFVMEHSDSKNKYSDIIKMLDSHSSNFWIFNQGNHWKIN